MPKRKFAVYVVIFVASALSGVYHGRHLSAKENAMKQDDDIFDLAREVMKDRVQH